MKQPTRSCPCRNTNHQHQLINYFVVYILYTTLLWGCCQHLMMTLDKRKSNKNTNTRLTCQFSFKYVAWISLPSSTLCSNQVPFIISTTTLPYTETIFSHTFPKTLAQKTHHALLDAPLGSLCAHHPLSHRRSRWKHLLHHDNAQNPRLR